MKRATRTTRIVEKVQVTFTNTVETQQAPWVQAPDGTWHLMNRHRRQDQLMACGAKVEVTSVTVEAIKGREYEVRPKAPEKQGMCPGCVEKATSGDLLVRRTDELSRQSDDPRRKFNWPTLCVCSGCGGYRSVYFMAGDVKRPDLALELALMQFGLSYLGRYANSPPSLSQVCQCETRVAELRKAVDALPWVSRGEWVRTGGNAQRGINDFSRTLQLSRQLTQEELSLVSEWLQKDACPGYTGCPIRGMGMQPWRTPGSDEIKGMVATYVSTTTWDSSD